MDYWFWGLYVGTWRDDSSWVDDKGQLGVGREAGEMTKSPERREGMRIDEASLFHTDTITARVAIRIDGITPKFRTDPLPYRDAKKAYDSTVTLAKSPWIRCSDRLPEEGVEVLV